MLMTRRILEHALSEPVIAAARTIENVCTSRFKQLSMGTSRP
jgi:hypothetical protein